MYKKQLLVVVESDALRRLYASHHGGFAVAVAMTSSEKKDYPIKMTFSVPQLHRASFTLGSVPDEMRIYEKFSCVAWVKSDCASAQLTIMQSPVIPDTSVCACFPRLYFFRDELALSCTQQIGAVGVSDLPEHLLTGSLAQGESSAPKFRKRLFIM